MYLRLEKASTNGSVIINSCHLSATHCIHNKTAHMQLTHLAYLRYGDFNVVYKPSFIPNNSQNASLVYGRRTSTRPGTIAPSPAAKPSGSAAPEPVRCAIKATPRWENDRFLLFPFYENPAFHTFPSAALPTSL